MKRSSLLFRTCIGWFLFGVLFLQSSYAQDSNSTNSIAMHAVLSDGYFKPQSPDVWSMIKYGNANIDYYTGTLGISIPIYTYKTIILKSLFRLIMHRQVFNLVLPVV